MLQQEGILQPAAGQLKVKFNNNIIYLTKTTLMISVTKTG